MEGVEKEMIAIQSESGSKLMTSVSCPIFILASFWPSWAFAATACGCSNIHVCILDGNEKTKEWATNVLGLPEGVVSLEQWKKMVSTWWHDKDEQIGCVLIQVSARMSEDTVCWLRKLDLEKSGSKRLVLMVGEIEPVSSEERRRRCFPGSCSGRGIDAWHSSVVEVSHEQVGGIFDQEWSVWVNWRLTPEEVSDMARESKVKALLGDYMSTTEKGRACQQPSDARPGGRFVWGDRGSQVKAKSVFSPTGWVDRCLKADEIMDVYDVGRSDRERMAKEWGENRENWPRNFTRQIPMRVLLRCLEVMMLPRVRLNGKNPKKRSQREMLNEKVKRRRQVDDEGKLNKLERDVIGMIQESMPNNSLEKELPVNVKLESKNDDAQARVLEWNRRACSKVMRNGSLEERHHRACEVVRRAMLRRYKHFRYCVILSFRRFMMQQHGNNWMEDM
jgi:hypothetical protein